MTTQASSLTRVLMLILVIIECNNLFITDDKCDFFDVYCGSVSHMIDFTPCNSPLTLTHPGFQAD